VRAKFLRMSPQVFEQSASLFFASRLFRVALAGFRQQLGTDLPRERTLAASALSQPKGPRRASVLIRVASSITAGSHARPAGDSRTSSDARVSQADTRGRPRHSSRQASKSRGSSGRYLRSMTPALVNLNASELRPSLVLRTSFFVRSWSLFVVRGRRPTSRFMSPTVNRRRSRAHQGPGTKYGPSTKNTVPRTDTVLTH
jgi:hypothetical protein